MTTREQFPRWGKFFELRELERRLAEGRHLTGAERRRHRRLLGCRWLRSYFREYERTRTLTLLTEGTPRFSYDGLFDRDVQ